MEKEYKYLLSDETVFDQIVAECKYLPLGKDAVELIDMKAIYFDTPEHDLLKQGVAYRIRHENERITATIKWDKDVRDGYHIREEFNLVVNDERYAENPNIEMFRSSDAYEVLLTAAGDKKLGMTVGMEYQRRQFKVDTGKSISCISVDNGVIHHIDGHDVPVLELEIEWYYGDEDDFMKLASEIQQKYQLAGENISKLQRAFI